MGGYLLRNFHEFGHHFGVDFIYLERDLLEAVKNELDDILQISESFNIRLENFVEIKRAFDFSFGQANGSTCVRVNRHCLLR